MGLFKTKPKPEHNLKHIASVIAAVDELIKKKVVRFSAGVVYLYPELWTDKKTAENWMKNLFIYYSLRKGHTPDKLLYFKEVETDNVLGFYKDKKAVVMKNSFN